MAISLFCYTNFQKDELEKILAELEAERQEIFATQFIITKAREADEIQREIAMEYGMEVKTVFLVCLNEKAAAARMREVAEIIMKSLGEDRVVVLFENERRI